MSDGRSQYRNALRDCLECGAKFLETLIRITQRYGLSGEILFQAESDISCSRCSKCGGELSEGVQSHPIYCDGEMVIWQEEVVCLGKK